MAAIGALPEASKVKVEFDSQLESLKRQLQTYRDKELVEI